MSQVLKVAELAGEQWGLVTTAQAARLGVAGQVLSRWAGANVLLRIAHGVYKVAGSPHDTYGDLRAAWLGLVPKLTATERLAERPIDAVISHRSAAVLHGLGDLDADVYEFTVASRRQSRREDVRIHLRKDGIPEEEWTLVSGLPVTTVLTTIVDLAVATIDGGHLAGVVRDAIATAVVDIDELSEALAPHAHRYGAPLGDGTGLVRRFLSEAGLPQTTERAAELVRQPGSGAEGLRALLAMNPAAMQQVNEALKLARDPANRQLRGGAGQP